ncbi:MAG: hypothetical protein JW996_07400 [Candidatus Cloacimonetes bacterium]|nr:hypothetical protein [Candidatus Cloacimonadota bacterium]
MIRASVIMLILGNLIPVLGVIHFGWRIFDIIFLFWLENLIIGFYNVLKMLIANPENKVNWFLKIFLIPFFCFHYGMFTAVHGIFVITLFGQGQFTNSGFPSLNLFINIISSNNLIWGMLAIFISHGFSFSANYIASGEYRSISVHELMSKPYGRIVILHLVILISGFLVMALKLDFAGLLLLIILKIFFDLKAHIKEHKVLAKKNQNSQSVLG